MVSWYSIYHNFVSYACLGNWRGLTAILQVYYTYSLLLFCSTPWMASFEPWVWKEIILTKFGTETRLFSESFNFLKLFVIFSLSLFKSYKHARWPLSYSTDCFTFCSIITDRDLSFDIKVYGITCIIDEKKTPKGWP